MADRPTARGLIRHALALYDADPAVEARARTAARSGFAGGLDFLRAQAGTRAGTSNGHRLGFAKYGACIAFALVVASGTAWALPNGVHLTHTAPVVSSAFVLAFYALESRLVFVFPAAAHGEARPFALSWLLTRGENALGIVLPIASWMLFGPLIGQGFVRAWATGCLAVSLWYRDVRGVP